MLVEHVGSVTVDFEMISIGGRIFDNFSPQGTFCVVIHAEIDKHCILNKAF